MDNYEFNSRRKKSRITNIRGIEMSHIIDNLTEVKNKLQKSHFGTYSRTYTESFYEIQSAMYTFKIVEGPILKGFSDANTSDKGYKERCALLLGVTRALINHIQFSQINRKYQIFISSTYKDLIPYRQKANSEIRYMGFFPVGMEDFHSSGINPWKYIVEVIETSDIYIVIIGSRYGSITTDGISFTQREYMYAKEKGLPVLTFIYNGELSLDASDLSINHDKFTAFVNLLETDNTVVYFKDVNELSQKITSSLYSTIRTTNLKGWIRF